MAFITVALPFRESRAIRHSVCNVRMTAATPRKLADTVASGGDITTARVGILGASGYTGAELLRLLAGHPRASVGLLTGERNAGKSIGSVYPQLAVGKHADLPELVELSQADYSQLDLVFACLPHAATQEIVSTLPESLRVVDLSADFRLRNVDTYAQWYGRPHQAPKLQETAVYGLTELNREAVRSARLVANPGCYPTAAQLPLIPLLKAGLISSRGIVIDAKSGATGAGRGAKTMALFCEVADGISAYGVASHRHSPEIEQGLSDAAGGGSDVVVSFTPHLLPMSRGILETIYVDLASGATIESVRKCLEDQYADEEFVHVLPEGVPTPQTRHVRASNLCMIQCVPDRVPGRVIIVSAIDNVVKGASGQAIQNMNLMLGFPEGMGLDLSPVFP